ncbi:putative riboflavin aldehyde-forming enzyme [Lentinula aciculospora]|uniref:Riboflavin aldehyde-forming enzyme n=1 Tax=Lentinula aciculospora TaxID=153920 RepID=A0A9W9A2K3_9AGAR|nr:putative riboflavin aldehyde-forming enzyme [Lentinula aciculospora]
MLLNMVYLFTSVLMLCLSTLVISRPIPRATDYSGGTGQGTYYDTGLTSCGQTYTDSDLIVALSHLFYDSYPGATANPNNNPVCGKKLTAHYQGKSVSVTVADRCTGCAMYDLDFTPTAFQALADMSVGRISGVTWAFDDSTSGTSSGNDTASDSTSDTSSSDTTSTSTQTSDSNSSSGDTTSTDSDSSSIANSTTTTTSSGVATTTPVSDTAFKAKLNKRQLAWARDVDLAI